MKFIFGKADSIVGKEENAGYKHFLLFPTMLSKVLFSRGA